MAKPVELLSYFNEENINLTWVRTPTLVAMYRFWLMKEITAF